MKLGAGQGKSFICLLLAAYHRNKDQPVTIVVTSKLLLNQYRKDLPIYLEDSKVEVVEASSLNPGYNINTVFICDEFDLMLEH